MLGNAFKPPDRRVVLLYQTADPYVPVGSFSQRLQVCTLNVCNPRFGVPNTLFRGHSPWYRDPNPRVQTPRVQRKTPWFSRRRLAPLSWPSALLLLNTKLPQITPMYTPLYYSSFHFLFHYPYITPIYSL